MTVKRLLESHNTPCLELSKSLVKSKGPMVFLIIERLLCASHFTNIVALNSYNKLGR